MNKEWSRRDFMKTGVAAAASVSLVGLLAESKARAEGYGDYGSGSSEGGANIIRIKDPANLTISEKKHSPFIQVDGPIKAGQPAKVTVSVGRAIHPMEAKHWIKWIELYAGETRIARVDLEPEVSQPVVTFTVVLSGPTTLRALEECNLHGIWEESLQV